jgi:hypothetical protein
MNDCLKTMFGETDDPLYKQTSMFIFKAEDSDINRIV